MRTMIICLIKFLVPTACWALPILALNLIAGFNGLEEAGFVNLLLALLLAAGAGKLWRKIRELQAQQDIFE